MKYMLQHYLYDSHDSDEYMKLSEGVNFCEILKKWHHMSILKIWKWICCNRFYDDDDINTIRTSQEILKHVDYREVWNELCWMQDICFEIAKLLFKLDFVHTKKKLI